MGKWESFKLNMKRGWIYSLISFAIYFVFVAIFEKGAFIFDIYLSSFRVLFKTGGDLLSMSTLLVTFIPAFFILTLILGSIRRKLELKQKGERFSFIFTILLGAFLIFLSSVIIFYVVIFFTIFLLF